MQNTLTTLLKPLLHTDTPVYVAYSGGLDSTVLLHLVKQVLDSIGHHRLYAIHVNHNLSANASMWQRHCRQVCNDWQIGFIAQSVALENNKESVEAQARRLRYQAIAQSIERGAVVLTGQHQDDQVETLLLQLKRGAGPKGLSAMAQSMSFADEATLLRPLLNQSRRELEQYAKRLKLSWIEDESNHDLRFDRNFIRHQITPQLNQRWPGFSQAVCRSVELIAQQQALVDELAAADLTLIALSCNTVDIDRLKLLSPSRQANLLRYWFDTLAVLMPSKVLLERVLNEVIAAKPDADPLVHWGGVQIRRYRHKLYLLNEFETVKGRDCALHLNQSVLFENAIGTALLSDTPQEGALTVPAPQPQQTISVRFGVEGLKIKPQGAEHHKKLNNLYKALGIPPWQRQRTPLLFYDQQLVAVGGHVAVGCETDNGAKAYFVYSSDE